MMVLLMLSAGLPSLLVSQTMWRMPITLTDSNTTSHSVVAYFGVHPNATNCVDVDTMYGFTDHWALFDYYGLVYTPNMVEIEPPPPSPSEDLRIGSVSPSSCTAPNYYNIQKYVSSSQVDTFTVVATPFDANIPDPMIYTVPSVISEYCDSLVIIGSKFDNFNNVLIKYDVNLAATNGKFVDYPTLAGDLLANFKLYLYHPKIGPGAPATITLLSPANGETGDSLRETLQWNPASPADFYHIQISTDPNFNSTIVDQQTTATSFYTPQLSGQTTYYWRVYVSSKYGLSYYQNPAFSFTTKSQTPDPPVLLLPTANQQNISLTPTFRWNSAVSQTSVLSYHVQVGTNANLTSIVKDTTFNDTTLIFGPLQNCTTYYWRVQATNTVGTGNYSAIRSFRTLLATPVTPAPIAPANGATGVAVTPTFSWSSSDVCSDDFRIQVARDTSSTPSFFIKTFTAQTSLAIGPLGQDSVYFWRVNSYNAFDSSNYTAWQEFQTILLPAAIPALIFPASNDTTVQPNDTFLWHSVPYEKFYHLQIATDTGFTNLVVNDSLITDTTFAVSGLHNCSIYYYKVRARNDNGSVGFSAYRKFKTRTAVPATPVLVTPFNNQDSVSFRPTLVWTAGDLCLGAYFVQVSRFNDFSDTAFQATTSQLSVQLNISLLGNTDYYWRVRSFNGVGNGPFSAGSHFKTTSFTPPDVPVLVSPADGVNDQPLTITFRWDTSARAATYRLQVAFDTGFTILTLNDSTIVQPDTGLVFRLVSSLINSKTYYWRVNAKNSAGTSAFSARRSFNTLAPPDAPILVSPANGATNVPIGQIFSWSVASRATQYFLEVARDSNFTNLFYSDSVITTTSWPLPNPLNGLTKYYWRVLAKNAVGSSPWSATSSFITERTGFANWLIPLQVAESGPASDVIYFGVNPSATNGIDPSLGEYELPPAELGWFDVRFVSPFIGQGLRVDYVPFVSYAQQDTFAVTFQAGIGTYPMKFSWSASLVKTVSDSMILVDHISGGTLRVRMDIDSTYSLANSSIDTLYVIVYSAYPLPTDVKPVKPGIPNGFVLYQNYPNPFNPTTHISFSVDRAAQVRVMIYNVLGQEISTVANGTFFPGLYNFEWNGNDQRGNQVPSGVFYVRMVAEKLQGETGSSDQFVVTRKILMMK